VDVFTIISHLALTISCSLSFYVYYGKYGAPKKGVHHRIATLRNLFKSRTGTVEEDINLQEVYTLDARRPSYIVKMAE
jgi:hypothetical protein